MSEADDFRTPMQRHEYKVWQEQHQARMEQDLLRLEVLLELCERKAESKPARALEHRALRLLRIE